LPTRREPTGSYTKGQLNKRNK